MTEVRSVSPAVRMTSSSFHEAATRNKMSVPACESPERIAASTAVSLLACARRTEASLRALSVEVATQISVQGKTDAIESVMGSNSLARAAVEVRAMIQQLESAAAAGDSNSSNEGQQ